MLKINTRLTFIFIGLTLSFHVHSQDSQQIENDWKIIKEKVEMRANIAISFSEALSKSKKIDKSIIENTKTLGHELKSICNEGLILDSLNVNELVNKNIELSVNLVKELVMLEGDMKLKKKKEIIGLIVQIEAIENQICLAVRRFNKNCEAIGKQGLCFKNNCALNPPQVIF